MNKLLKQTLVCAGTLLLSMQVVAKPSSEAKEVRGIIDKVNTYWQTHNKPEVRSFWDNAAYHTGNMEAYFLTGNENYRAYSETWAIHNEWKGAKEKDKSKWKYSYGESDEYVLFGDYQVCFQTYIDLYNILPDNYKIARAREVMEYEMSTPNHDYWWWSDGLYMVMPVMTKLYKVTGNHLYLDKLYEYIVYSDSIMLDRETGLYYRDAKYVYPKHKTSSGKKDFWARGDGWVLAGLAKVLKDLPADYEHRSFFVNKYVKLAEAVAAIQQPEGYWTRSMMDPTHAPGPETSGTAFFTYGFLWGINNGYLDEAVYKPVINKAWNYLAKTALQKNGKIGYVQPIGEKAIPGQVVDADSEANFGVGAFLLAACEYVRYLEAPENQDRAYWCNLLYKMAAPVLSNMAEGNLKKNMLVEVSPNWDGRNKGVTYMETFGRLMAGVAPWLTLPDDDTEEGRMRKQLREWAECDEYRINSAIRKVEEWYTGDGWYADGPSFAFDYYSSYVFHPMYLETLQGMKDAGKYTRIHYKKYYDRALKRARKFSLVLERLISPEGTFPVFGRSIPYRLATMQPLALMAWYQQLPEGVSNGQARAALTSVMHRMYDNTENFNEAGFLTIGFAGRQPNVADWYTNNGSLYMTSLAFLPLGLPAAHPFWTDAAQPCTQAKAWGGQPFPKDHHWSDDIRTWDLF